MEQKSAEEDDERPGAEMIVSVAKCALAIGTCLYQGAKAVLAIRDAGVALHKTVKEKGPGILKVVKRRAEQS